MLITKYENIFSKDYTKNWPRDIFLADSVLETNPLAYKIKDVNGEKIIGSFYEKELLLSYSKFSPLETKKNKLDQKIPDATTLIHIN